MLDPQARSAHLDAACAGDSSLRGRVERLLRAGQHADEFLAGDPLGLGESGRQTILVPQLSEGPGTVIGNYKLLEKLGEGGFGVVYMAEQKQPIKRRVALKIIKVGMDTREVVARFEAERQALALMDHPNIAKVFDAGATEAATFARSAAVPAASSGGVPPPAKRKAANPGTGTVQELAGGDACATFPAGRPYFVMELVRGIRITDYCNGLDLFTQVCQAVEHAHQKGIIHRDLKPSNILVTVNDAVAVPKIIDFGIAKATQMELTEKTLFTQGLNNLTDVLKRQGKIQEAEKVGLEAVALHKKLLGAVHPAVAAALGATDGGTCRPIGMPGDATVGFQATSK